jgi:mRNA interferase MazF
MPAAQQFFAGQIVLADWRGDALPREPNKRRPAILVPLTDDAALVIPDLATEIAPTPENGCPKPCWAASHLIATTSKSRLTATGSRVTAAQLTSIRRQITVAIGAER